MKKLTGKIAVVAGATRGAGRGIACMLGEAGATVYCTGRSSRKNPPTPERPETIEETAEMVTAYGGIGIPVQVDHSDEEQVQQLFELIRTQHGKIDILVNDIWGGDVLIEFGKPFWELKLENGFAAIQNAIFTHLITSRYAVPLMLENKGSIIFEITDGDGFFYRGNLIYDFIKTSIIRVAFGMAQELRPHGVTALSVTPGFLRSEAMLELFGVTEDNWQDGAKKDKNFISSETPYYVGRGVAALASDPDVFCKTGRVFSSWVLAREYGLVDIDGRQPLWDEHVEKEAKAYRYKKLDDAFYDYWKFEGGNKVLGLEWTDEEQKA
ncbi:SDR family oxidoreductase [Chitinophaga horti]|uniref:SDR family oxidoreductase n=1 Tax=Chitinophaga horti TaxID=2920382 RepID=A0ABY6J1J8_9BACT|nr:SDR family oxidoreductase [Chitinophaga horti]UYQ93433.1 SDR family oxidoreductase [Chitinophaga horti]